MCVPVVTLYYETMGDCSSWTVSVVVHDSVGVLLVLTEDVSLSPPSSDVLLLSSTAADDGRYRDDFVLL